MLNKLVMLIIFSLSGSTFAGTEVRSPVTKITSITAFSEYGGGDVIVSLENNGDVCTHGYWLKKTDFGFQASLSMAIAAYQAKNNVELLGFPDQKWSGSGNMHCHLYALIYR
jgi:hypothetical protein